MMEHSHPAPQDLVEGMTDSAAGSGPLVAMLIGSVGTLGFLAVATLMSAGTLTRFDNAVFLAFRSPHDVEDPIGPFWLEEFAAEITALGGYPVLSVLILLVVLYLVIDRRFGPALFVVVTTAGGTLLSTVLKFGFSRPRPDLVEHLDNIYTASFPSGHAMASAVAYLTLGAVLAQFVRKRRLRTFVTAAAITLALLVGVSRIYLGVHWPSDVLAGWSVGAAWAALCWLSTHWLRDRRARRSRSTSHPPAASGEDRHGRPTELNSDRGTFDG